MGSLKFFDSSYGRQFGAEIARGEARDIDGVLLSITLNVDSEGDLFELDIWKVDFSELKRLPTPDEIEAAAV